MFAVIEVFMERDFIQKLEFVYCFDTKDDAQLYIDVETGRVHQSNLVTYVDDYVDKIKVPDDANYQEWYNFVYSYISPVDGPPTGWSPMNFKHKLKFRLYAGGVCKKEDYQPLELPIYRNLHIVEISEKISFEKCYCGSSNRNFVADKDAEFCSDCGKEIPGTRLPMPSSSSS